MVSFAVLVEPLHIWPLPSQESIGSEGSGPGSSFSGHAAGVIGRQRNARRFVSRQLAGTKMMASDGVSPDLD